MGKLFPLFACVASIVVVVDVACDSTDSNSRRSSKYFFSFHFLFFFLGGLYIYMREYCGWVCVYAQHVEVRTVKLIPVAAKIYALGKEGVRGVRRAEAGGGGRGESSNS